ncbi:MAG: hypothetical protein AAF657_11035 [Acidobacteriota bacterium]
MTSENPPQRSESGSPSASHGDARLSPRPRDRPLGQLEKRWLIAGILLASVALAVSNAFVQDDAFISFRYARNLVETGELTWNPGEPVPVEGYTNFLWTLLLAAALALGCEPVLASRGLSLLALLGTLVATYRLALATLGAPARAALAIGLLGTNYTFSCFATGGLETQLQALLITTSALLAWRIAQPGSEALRDYAILSVLCAAAVMTRPDSALPCTILVAWVWIAGLRQRPPVSEVLARGIATLAPALLLLGPWLAWKLAYYGRILPNTFDAKVSAASLATIGQGLGYGLNFVLSYQLLPFLVLAIALGRRLWRRQDLLVLCGVVLAWAAYLMRVGGDFMEFRMVVPVLPFVFILIAFLILQLEPLWCRILLVALLLFGSAHHALRFRDGGGLESIATLRGYLENEHTNWPGAGMALGELFGESLVAGRTEPVRIATTAAGAIPYYSRLETVDMLGLNDLWVARNGSVVSLRSGHSRQADLQYLLRREVHLMLGHPHVARLDEAADKQSIAISSLQRLFLVRIEPEAIPRTARVVEIPIDSTYGLRVLYLLPHPWVDEVIEREELETWRLAWD